MKARAAAVILAVVVVAFPPEPARAQDEPLPCPDCNPPNRFWAGAAELMAVQFVPWGFTKWVTHGEWSNISFRTWADNLKFRWQWDNNKFNNNQFAHPYHGSLYFNAARANGYDFWHSAPWAFGGSLMWELFGEVWAPSPNDLANTTLGGITLGEMLFRFSSLVLDNRATGGNRVVREVGAGLINPVRGFNRLVRGEVGRISETPPDGGRAGFRSTMDVGYRRFSTSSALDDPDARDQSFVQFRGELRGSDRGSGQEAVFRLSRSTARSRAGRPTTRRCRSWVRGNLAAEPLGSDESGTRLGLLMTYEYLSNPAWILARRAFRAG